MDISLMSSSRDIIRNLWLAARNCYCRGGVDEANKSYDENKAIKLLSFIHKKNHLSIFEHSFFQFNITGVSRSLMAQLTRHRIGWSFAIQSQHYQKHDNFNYKELEEYIDEEQRNEYHDLMNKINSFYTDALNRGLPRYIAREVLPNSTHVNIIASTNLRALSHFWDLRSGKENTPEIRKLANGLYEVVKVAVPRLEEIIRRKK